MVLQVCCAAVLQCLAVALETSNVQEMVKLEALGRLRAFHASSSTRDAQMPLVWASQMPPLACMLVCYWPQLALDYYWQSLQASAGQSRPEARSGRGTHCQSRPEARSGRSTHL